MSEPEFVSWSVWSQSIWTLYYFVNLTPYGPGIIAPFSCCLQLSGETLKFLGVRCAFNAWHIIGTQWNLNKCRLKGKLRMWQIIMFQARWLWQVLISGLNHVRGRRLFFSCHQERLHGGGYLWDNNAPLPEGPFLNTFGLYKPLISNQHGVHSTGSSIT